VKQSETVIVSNEEFDMLGLQMVLDIHFFKQMMHPRIQPNPGTRIGPLSLGSLPLGDAREATVKELDLLDA